MIWNLIGVFIMGICAGGTMFFLRKVSRNRLPRWLISMSAAAGMFGYLAYYDYSWFEFKSGQIPFEASLISTQQNKSFFRPWGYIWPSTNAFTVFDGHRSAVQQNGELLVEYYLYTFHKDPIERLDTESYVINCSRKTRVLFDRETPGQALRVETVTESDPMYQKLCV
ncbi:hypothetical protein [Azoarcus taiwanensis]|uniref:Transmembrane protein n=1 Tax=Azoarcus taiwanensis TaxID=666964 RepID=A0A972FLA7_9RHOO|nr:hypothetical protein [Azoarcus taiwanensis]NMG04366.1 hypothetical protein [Azoarcus taiwanensis]